MGAPRDQTRQRCFAAARRSPKNHGAQIVALDSHAQRFSWAQHFLLAGELFQRAGAHAFGKRLRSRWQIFRLEFCEEAHRNFLISKYCFSANRAGAPLRTTRPLQRSRRSTNPLARRNFSRRLAGCAQRGPPSAPNLARVQLLRCLPAGPPARANLFPTEPKIWRTKVSSSGHAA